MAWTWLLVGGHTHTHSPLRKRERSRRQARVEKSPDVPARSDSGTACVVHVGGNAGMTWVAIRLANAFDMGRAMCSRVEGRVPRFRSRMALVHSRDGRGDCCDRDELP